MRIAVEHRTRYSFTDPQSRLVQLLRLSPDDSDDQSVVTWRIDVDCDARLRHHRDGLGNKVAMLYAEGPLSEIEITVQGEVLTSATRGFVSGTDEPLPPEFFLRETDRTIAGPALAEFARQAIADGERIAAIDAANRALHERFTLVEASADLHRGARDSFDGREASGREMAQMLVAGLRAGGIPARYVSGYRQGELAGCAPHGWAEAHVEADGWLAVDPSTGGRVDERYVRVAVGLDMGGAAPVAGSRLGPGEEVLDVDLRVDASGWEE